MSAISNASRILVLIGVLFVCLSLAGALVGFVGDVHRPAPDTKDQDGPVEKENTAEQAKFFLLILGVCSLDILKISKTSCLRFLKNVQRKSKMILGRPIPTPAEL